MGNVRFNVAVSFDDRRGYVGTHPELRLPVTALSLGGLRRRIEIALLPEVDVDIRLELDRHRARNKPLGHSQLSVRRVRMAEVERHCGVSSRRSPR